MFLWIVSLMPAGGRFAGCAVIHTVADADAPGTAGSSCRDFRARNTGVVPMFSF